MKKHKCISTCQNNSANYKALDEWHIAGCGETLEKNWLCKCGRGWREVYIFSCEIDNDTERIIGEG